MAPVSGRMFGNRSGTFLALGHSFPSYLILFFSLKLERGAAGQDASGGQPTCVRVDEPQGSGQQGPDHEGRKGDAHHRRSVQHVQRVWKERQRTNQTCTQLHLHRFHTSLLYLRLDLHNISHPILIGFV